MKRISVLAAVLVVGLLLGAMSPVGAHVTDDLGHLFDHIKTKLVQQGYVPRTASLATGRSFQEPIPAGGVVASLSANGTGAIKVPFKGRIQANGAIVIANNAGAGFIGCYLRMTPGPVYMSPRAIDYIANQGTTIPLVGYADVEPGTYDIEIYCSEDEDLGWVDASLNVTAVRR